MGALYYYASLQNRPVSSKLAPHVRCCHVFVTWYCTPMCCWLVVRWLLPRLCRNTARCPVPLPASSFLLSQQVQEYANGGVRVSRHAADRLPQGLPCHGRHQPLEPGRCGTSSAASLSLYMQVTVINASLRRVVAFESSRKQATFGPGDTVVIDHSQLNSRSIPTGVWGPVLCVRLTLLCHF